MKIDFYSFEFARQLSEVERQKMADLLNSLTDEQKEAIAKYGEYQYWEGHDVGSANYNP